MPLDDLSLTPASGRVPEEPQVEAMTRILRLPTHSVRQARSIVRLQLDRLSPLPPSEVLFDLVRLRDDGAEGVFALGILRRALLRDPALASRRTIAVRRIVEDAEVVFRFRNAAAASDWEARWLRHAPQAALIGLGVAAVMLAGQLRADQWRERRVPEIAAAQRAAAVQARMRREQQAAQGEWLALERTDAATRLLCVSSRVQAAAPSGLLVASLSVSPDQVSLAAPDSKAAERLTAAGGEILEGGGEPATVRFAAEVCG